MTQSKINMNIRKFGVMRNTEHDAIVSWSTVFFPLAGAALFAFTASVGVMEVSGAVMGKDC